MPVFFRTPPRLRFALVPTLLLAVAYGLTVRAQPPETPKKESKPAPPKELPGLRLPDGTFLWYGMGDGDDRVSLTPQELRKLQDQIDQLKKQVAAHKAVAPSGCAIRGRVEKRGEQLVAALKLTNTFRTTAPQTVVALGGRKGFLVGASLDDKQLPILETVDDGFAALIESAGDHTLTLELESPVTVRGAKPELGFEIGLPRAAITTLLLDPPGPDVKRVNLTTRTSDPAQPPRRVPSLDVAQLASRPGQETGYPLGPVESLEVTWDPPAAAAVQPVDQVQSADLDISVLITESIVETTARIRLHGSARTWKFAAPANATVTVERNAAVTDVGPAQSPTIARPSQAKPTEWTIVFPGGQPAADWTITAVAREMRPPLEDPRHRGPFPVGPFAVLDVLRQTGTIRITADAHTRLVFTPGPDLRRAEPPGPVEDDVKIAFFRLATGPTGAIFPTAPLITIEASRVRGRVALKPTYKLTHTEAGWKIRVELKVIPISAEVDSLAVDIPVEWRGLDASPPEIVEFVQQGASPEGFWAALASQLGASTRLPVVVHLAAAHRQPFDLVLTATVPVPAGAAEAAIPFPRFPGAVEREAAITAAVPEGLDLRGEIREWDGEHAAAWGSPLSPLPGPNGKASKAVTTVTGRADGGMARAMLFWQPHRPDFTADIRADITLFDRHMLVQQTIRLRSPDGLPRSLHVRGPGAAAGLRVQPASMQLESHGPGEWSLAIPPDARDITLRIDFGIPVSPSPAEESGTRQVPVGLLWPASTVRADTTVRVWSNTMNGRTLANRTSGWRELPIEPVADREALPALVLAAAGGEIPLVLESRPIDETAGAPIWVDRALIQAWADDGTTRYRARFLLRRWLAPAVDVRLPETLSGSGPEFFRDGQRIDAIPVSDPGRTRAFRVPLPEPRPGRTALIEIRFQLPPPRGANAEYLPPLLPGAAFSGLVRWQIAGPGGTLPLLLGGAAAEFLWHWSSGTFAPGSIGTSEGLEHWLKTGDEPGAGGGGDSLTARQTTPGAIAVYQVPRIGFIIVASAASFVVLLALTRLPTAALGPVIAVLVAAFGIAAAFWPQPAAQFAGAGQPGVAAFAGMLLVHYAIRSYHRRRTTYLPGFSRSLPELSAVPAPVPSTARNRPAAVGSSGAAPVVPAGG